MFCTEKLPVCPVLLHDPVEAQKAEMHSLSSALWHVHKSFQLKRYCPGWPTSLRSLLPFSAQLYKGQRDEDIFSLVCVAYVIEKEKDEHQQTVSADVFLFTGKVGRTNTSMQHHLKQ